MAIDAGTAAGAPGQGFQAWLGSVQREFHVQAEVLEQPPVSFTGTVRRHDVGRLTLLEATGTSYAASHTRVNPPSSVNVLVSLQGATSLEQSSFKAVLRAGECCLLDARQPSRTVIAGPFRNVVARFPLADVNSILPDWEMSIGTVIDGRSGVGAVFVDIVRSILRRSGGLEEDNRSGVFDATIDLLGSTLRALPHHRRPAPSHMESFHLARIKRFVAEHLRDPELDVDAVSRGLGLSVRHIHRLFRGEAQHLMHWVWSERLRQCYADLNRPSLRHRTVAEIAYSWGFNDSAHFSRAFRARYGIAPSEARRRAQSPADAP